MARLQTGMAKKRIINMMMTQSENILFIYNSFPLLLTGSVCPVALYFSIYCANPERNSESGFLLRG
jgi:hypothetical protein